jgi:hypothetical protein
MKREICCPQCAANWERLDGVYAGEYQKRITGTLHVACVCDDCGKRLSMGDTAVAVSLYSDFYPYRGPWEHEYLITPGPELFP